MRKYQFVFALLTAMLLGSPAVRAALRLSSPDGRNVADDPNHQVRTVRTLRSGDALDLHLGTEGGAAIRFVRQNGK